MFSHSIENGYLADKNELIERAIELQEQQYKSELRQMTTTEKLSEVIKGYAASYDKLKNSDILTTDTDLSNNMWGMTDQETVMLIETEQRCKSNTHRIDNLENELKEIQSEQKAIPADKLVALYPLTAEIG